MFEQEESEGDLVGPQEPAPPGVKMCIRFSTYICSPIGHAVVTFVAMFYWYDSMMVIFQYNSHFVPNYNYAVLHPMENYIALTVSEILFIYRIGRGTYVSVLGGRDSQVLVYRCGAPGPGPRSFSVDRLLNRNRLFA
jgi:hypothetical protein